jgi:hypothetical protein
MSPLCLLDVILSMPRISREHVGKLACLRAQSAAAAGCEARSAERPADDNTRRFLLLCFIFFCFTLHQLIHNCIF